VYVLDHERERWARENSREVFARYASFPKASVSAHSIRFRQVENYYEAGSSLMLYNSGKQPLDTVVLYLNPGLEVTSLYTGGLPLKYSRDRQVLLLPLTLSAGDSCRVELNYRGKIDPAVCYADVSNVDSVACLFRRCFSFRAGNAYHYLRPDYTLLTPEVLWYPVAKAPVDVTNPWLAEEDYSFFRLEIEGEKKRTVISQGRQRWDGDRLIFEQDYPLPGLVLCMGEYTRRSVTVDGVEYSLYLFPGHENIFPDNFTRYNMEATRTQEWTVEMEGEEVVKLLYAENQKKGLGYVFDRLNFVETPIHFSALGRKWKKRSEWVHPEVFFRPERELFAEYGSLNSKKEPFNQVVQSFYYRLIKPTRGSVERDVILNRLNRRIRREGISVPHEGNVSDVLRSYQYRVYSEEFPRIEFFFSTLQVGLESKMKKSLYGEWNKSSLRKLALQDKLEDYAVIARVQQLLLYLLLQCTSEELYQFNKTFMKGLDLYQSFNYEDYCEEMQQQLGVDLLGLTRFVYDGEGAPAYVLRGERVDFVEGDAGREGYVFSVMIQNKGEMDGIITVKGEGQEKHYLIPSGSCKEVKRFIASARTNVNPKVSVIYHVSKNSGGFVVFEKFPRAEVLRAPVDGVFEGDTSIFAQKPGVYVVDNTDEGFRVIEEINRVTALKNQRRGKNYRGTCWNKGDFAWAYGDIRKDYLEKRSNWGDSDVEWSVTLPESGVYELFVWNVSFWMKGGANRDQEKDPSLDRQYYTFTVADGEGKAEINPAQDGAKWGDWVSLGIYSLQAGKNAIRLSGRGAYPTQMIMADAVKWMKVR